MINIESLNLYEKFFLFFLLYYYFWKKKLMISACENKLLTWKFIVGIHCSHWLMKNDSKWQIEVKGKLLKTTGLIENVETKKEEINLCRNWFYK